MKTTSSRSPDVQYLSHSPAVVGGTFRLHGVGPDRSARLPHLFDHLCLGETRVVEGHGHYTAEKSGPRTPNPVDPLRFVLEPLLRRAGRTPAQSQNRPAILLVPDRRKPLRDVPNSFLTDQLGIEVDRERVMRRVDRRAHHAGLHGCLGWRATRLASAILTHRFNIAEPQFSATTHISPAKLH